MRAVRLDGGMVALRVRFDGRRRLGRDEGVVKGTRSEMVRRAASISAEEKKVVDPT